LNTPYFWHTSEDVTGLDSQVETNIIRKKKKEKNPQTLHVSVNEI